MQCLSLFPFMNNIECCIDYLKPATQFRVAGKYARSAIANLKQGALALAREDCLNGHFVSGHDGDTSFLPVRVWLDQVLAQ